MFWLFGTYHSIQLAGVTAVKPLHVQGKIIYKLMTVPVLSLPGHLLLPAWADRSSPDLCILPQSEFAPNPILTPHCPTPWKETLDVSAASQWITLLCPAPHCRDPSVALHSERLWGWPSDATISYHRQLYSTATDIKSFYVPGGDRPEHEHLKQKVLSKPQF